MMNDILGTPSRQMQMHSPEISSLQSLAACNKRKLINITKGLD